LIRADTFGLSDPYLKLSIKNQEVETAVKYVTLDPAFNTDATFSLADVDRERDKLRIVCYDWNQFYKHEFMGCINIPIRKCIADEQTSRWYPLMQDDSLQPGFIPTGDFQLRFTYSPVKTTGANRAFAEDFIGIFSANSAELCNFLEFIDASKVERKRKNEHEKTEKSDKIEYSTAIYDTLLELYLQDNENDTEEMWRAKREKAKQLLARKDDIRFDKNHALLVCQMYGFNDGTISLYKQLNLPTQVAQNYMEQNDYKKKTNKML